MPIIAFDVLIPTADASGADDVHDAFQRALDLLVKKDRLTSASLEREENPAVDEAIVAELREVYARDHDDEDPGEVQMHRYLIDAAGEGVSYNSLAMGLSRILNPKADLPSDRLALEQQDNFEGAAVYPWTVEIRR